MSDKRGALRRKGRGHSELSQKAKADNAFAEELNPAIDTWNTRRHERGNYGYMGAPGEQKEAEEFSEASKSAFRKYEDMMLEKSKTGKYVPWGDK